VRSPSASRIISTQQKEPSNHEEHDSVADEGGDDPEGVFAKNEILNDETRENRQNDRFEP
jgi:hypothetical protein